MPSRPPMAGLRSLLAGPFRSIAWAAAVPLPAFAPGPLDNVHGRAERGFYIHVRGVEQVSVGRFGERRGRAPRNAGNALTHFVRHE